METFAFVMRGGFMMIPILLSFLAALSLILERLVAFHKTYATPPDFTRRVLTGLEQGRRAEAEKACQEQARPVCLVLGAGIAHLEDSLEEMELAMKNEAESWVPRLERYLHVVDTVITAAPLMGLLGTILGMIGSFNILSTSGMNQPSAITGGVAEALIATATGLVVALVCLVAYNGLNARVKEFIYEMESAASRLVELRHGLERRKAHADTAAAR